MNNLFLGLDVGHTVIKAAVYDERGKELEVVKNKINLLSPNPGWLEISTEELWRKIKETLRGIKVGSRKIVGIGLSGGGDGFFALNENKNPVNNGILALDMRAQPVLDEFKKDGRFEKLFEICGMHLLSSNIPTMLSYLKKRDKTTYEKIKNVLSYKDFVRFKLTEEISTEISDAFGLLNVKTQQYDKRIFEICEVEEKFDVLPDLKQNSYDIGGYVTEKASKETGLKAGTPVMMGAHDAACNTLGAGITGDNVVCSGGGTWSINLMVVDKPIIDHMWSCESFIQKGKWLLEGASPTSATSINWFLENFFDKKQKEEELYDLCDKEVSNVRSAIIFHPFLMGLPWHLPYQPDASGAFLGLTAKDDKREMLRAVYEAVAFIHTLHIEQFVKKIGVEEIRFTGGVSKNAIISQMLADVLDKEITIIDKEETGCFGAAFLAAMGVGDIKNIDEIKRMVHKTKVYSPDEDNRKRYVYEKKYEIFKKSCNAFSDLWGDLSNLRRVDQYDV